MPQSFGAFVSSSGVPPSPLPLQPPTAAVMMLAEQALLKSKVGGQSDGAQVSGAVKNALLKSKSRYEEVVVLEASIREIHKMFDDFALMVEEQSELLDNIEFQTKMAGNYVGDGMRHAEELIRLTRKVRKKRCCVIIIVLTLLVLAVFFFKIV